jgi:mannose-6-phosphate isomerase
VVFVPPGTVHALCKNVMVYEVQQSSDLTFRIWDYNRPGVDGKPRNLHIERSLDVIGFGAEMPKPQHWTDLNGADAAHAVLVASDYFQLERFALTKRRDHCYDSFSALTVLSGMARMKGEQEMFLARAGETFFVPARRGFSVVPAGGDVVYLIAS